MLGSFNDRVLILPDPIVERERNGIIITSQLQEELDVTQRGKVVAFGFKCTQVNIGQRVIWNKYSGLKITDDGVVYLSIKEDELLAFEPQDAQVQQHTAVTAGAAGYRE